MKNIMVAIFLGFFVLALVVVVSAAAWFNHEETISILWWRISITEMIIYITSIAATAVAILTIFLLIMALINAIGYLLAIIEKRRIERMPEFANGQCTEDQFNRLIFPRLRRCGATYEPRVGKFIITFAP